MKKQTFIKTCLRTPGGKSKALSFLLQYIPLFMEYRENFLGGGSLFLRLAQLYPDKIYHINDLQYAIYAFWNTLYNNSDTMIRFLLEQKNGCKNKEDGRELHTRCRREIDLVDSKDEFLTACYWYILNKTSFSGLARIGSYAPQAFDSNFTIRCINNLKNVSEVMHGVKSLKITNLDYSELLSPEGENIFLYCDPPYKIGNNYLYGKNGNMHEGFDHKLFADRIKQCKHKWLITYNQDEEIKTWFSEYQQVPWDLTYTMKAAKRKDEDKAEIKIEYKDGEEPEKSGKKGKELLIMNYE